MAWSGGLYNPPAKFRKTGNAHVHTHATGTRAICRPHQATETRATYLAALARQAMIAEAELTPKPGLVDRRGPGAHADLTLTIMRRSALAIEPYLYEMVVASRGVHPSQSLRERLALLGRLAEKVMLKATGGSNSHKGAIWTLGLLVSAAAMHHNDTVPASTSGIPGGQTRFLSRSGHTPVAFSRGHRGQKVWSAWCTRRSNRRFSSGRRSGLADATGETRKGRERNCCSIGRAAQHHGPTGRHLPAPPWR